MMSHEEAQELHRIIGGMYFAATDGGGQYDTLSSYEGELERARELASLLVHDTEPGNP